MVCLVEMEAAPGRRDELVAFCRQWLPSAIAAGCHRVELLADPKHPDAKIIETPTAFVSTASESNINIPREICQRELTREEAIQLFTKKETEVLEGFISRAGKPFAASLYIKRTGRHGFRFGNRG